MVGPSEKGEGWTGGAGIAWPVGEVVVIAMTGMSHRLDGEDYGLRKSSRAARIWDVELAGRAPFYRFFLNLYSTPAETPKFQ